jgi:hypothetical protein
MDQIFGRGQDHFIVLGEAHLRSTLQTYAR